jgi:uncharacterized membrane protein YidH (DUF202 family)
MKTNPLLAGAAALDAALGIALTFAPGEIAAWAGMPNDSTVGTWLLQAVGAAFLALAWLNWIQRHQKIRGIYGRPVLLPNLLFNGMLCLNALGALRRQDSGDRSALLLTAAIVCGGMAVAFGSRLWARSVPEAESRK